MIHELNADGVRSRRPWLSLPWNTSDDRVRGGSSRSSLVASPSNCALFKGHLDIETLGGAGFASQFQSAALVAPNSGDEDAARDGVWDLGLYNGIELVIGPGDSKIYTFILKDELPQDKRDDGRDKAGINWEADFSLGTGSEFTSREGTQEKVIWIPWEALKATFRGREIGDDRKLNIRKIRRIGLMIRR